MSTLAVKGDITAGAVGGFLVKQIGAAIVTKAANQFIVPQLFDALGLSESDDAEKYAQMVMAEMRRLAQDLGKQIEQVQDSVNRVAALTIKIDAYQQQEGLSQILRTFNAESTKLEERFDEFSNDVQELSATNESKSRAALKDLYVRLRTPHDTEVAVAMRNIHNLVIPPTSGDRGILDYLADIVGQSVVNAAPQLMTAAPCKKGDWRKEFCLPGDVDYMPANRLMNEAPAAVNKELQTVRSVFHRILAAQTKGLMFLSRAWSGNPQERSLQLHIDNIVAEIAAMKGFYARCVPQIAASIGKAVQQYGKSLTGEITRLPWLEMRGWHNQGLWKDVPEGLNTKWIVWDVNMTDRHGEVSPDKTLVSATVVEEPWMVGQRRALDIAMDGFRGEGASFIRQSMAEFRPIRYVGTEPDELVSMLKTLPATSKELREAAEAAIGK